MILTVLVLSSTLLSVTLIGGFIMLYQIRHAGDFTNSGKAIFAADTGVNWWGCFSSGGCTTPPNSSGTISNLLKNSNGSRFTIEELPGGSVKIVGQAGNSKRALLIETIPTPPGPIPCAPTPIDLMILVDRSSSMSPSLSPPSEKIQNALKNFFVKLGVGPALTDAHVGLVSFSGASTLENLTGDPLLADSYVDAITIDVGDNANLATAIDAAIVELVSIRDRADASSPDYIIIITDDVPNLPFPLPPPLTAAENAANTAKGANIELLTAYGGTVASSFNFYANKIVSSPSSTHLYIVDDFSNSVPLVNMLQCN